MKIKNEKELFELVCDTDAENAKYHKPFLNKEDGNVWATDGRISLIINPECLAQKYRTDSQKIGLDSKECVRRVVRLGSIEKALQSCPKIKIKAKATCDECAGSGHVRWIYKRTNGEEYENAFECPICHGDGLVSEYAAQLYDPYSFIGLGEACFLAKYIEKLKRAMQLLNQEKAVLTTNSRQGISTLEMANAKIKFVPHFYAIDRRSPLWASLEFVEIETFSL